MRGRSLPILAFALVFTACASVESSSLAEIAASSTPETADQTQPHAPARTPQLTPAPQPTPTPQPTPFGAAVFADSDDCTNPEAGYRVAYPDTWYSNAAVPNPFDPAGEGLPACRLFAPTDFDVGYGTGIPWQVAIWIRVEELPEGTEWNYGPFSGSRILSDSDTAVGGQPARVQEIEVTSHSAAFRPGHRQVEYVIGLSASKYLVARTLREQDFETSRRILDQMMQSLEFISL